MGSSGSGKTSLLNIMAGLAKPTSGSIYSKESAIHNMTPNQAANWRLQNTAFIFQSFELLDNLTAAENVTLPLEMKGTKAPQRIAIDYLEKVGLAHRINHYPATLSGGEQQRVAIARAFAVKPDILFADEPTGSLDDNTSEQINKLLFDLNKHRSTLVIVTHDESVAKQCNKTYQLSRNRLL